MEETYEMPQNVGLLAGIGMVFIIFWLAVVVLMVISMWKIYSKAGKPGWASIIPIYNMVVMLQIAGRPIWWILLMLIPLVNLVFIIILYMDLSKSFGKDGVYGLGLFFLGIVFFPMLAFGSATYVGPAGGEGSI